MKRIVWLLGLTLAVGIGAGVIGTKGLSAQQPSMKRTELLQDDLAVIGGKQVAVYRTQFAPGASSAKHRHPGDTFVYILDGTLTLEEEGKGPRTLNPGEVVHEVPTGVYTATNTSLTSPLTTLAFSLGEKGQPFLVPVK